MTDTFTYNDVLICNSTSSTYWISDPDPIRLSDFEKDDTTKHFATFSVCYNLPSANRFMQCNVIPAVWHLCFSHKKCCLARSLLKVESIIFDLSAKFHEKFLQLLTFSEFKQPNWKRTFSIEAELQSIKKKNYFPATIQRSILLTDWSYY